MQYFGGKARYAKNIATIINLYIKDKDYVEPFCGSCNVMSQVKTNGTKYGYDKHPYLIAMWQKVTDGWIPPENISEEQYKYIKQHPDEKPYLTGFVGFACSFAGKWWGGYARNNKHDNYALRSCKSIDKKKHGLDKAKFECKDFREVNHKNCVIYCDPPYKNTTPYYKSILGEFPYEEFIEWVKKQSQHNIVIVSEYKHNIPEDAKILWEKESTTMIRDSSNQVIKTTEVLWTFNDIA